MKNISVNINGQSYDITYNIRETDKGNRFDLTNIPSELGMGNDYEFGVWESNNVYDIPKLANETADQNMALIVSAILEAEGIDYKS